MKFYLNENIFIDNDIFYYENDKKNIKIKNSNWHIYLSEYGWNKLNKKWIIKLNKLTNKKKKNSTFGVLDCGGNGDCLFHCISYSLNKNMDSDSSNLRLELSEYITKDHFNDIINIYKILKSSDDFDELWDPKNTSFEDFKKLIRNGGDNYWGDFLILNILKEFLDINIIILYSNDITNEYYYYPINYEYNDDKKSIILLYENEIHFKLIGHFSGNKMITNFDKDSIPEEILNMVKIR